MITLRGKLTRTLVERKSPVVDSSLSAVSQPQPITQTPKIITAPPSQQQSLPQQQSCTAINIPQRVNAEGKLVPVITTTAITSNNVEHTKSNVEPVVSQTSSSALASATASAPGANNDNNAIPQDVNKSQTISSSSLSNNNALSSNNNDNKNCILEECWTWSGIWAFGELDDNAEMEMKMSRYNNNDEEKEENIIRSRGEVVKVEGSGGGGAKGGEEEEVGIKKKDDNNPPNLIMKEVDPLKSGGDGDGGEGDYKKADADEGEKKKKEVESITDNKVVDKIIDTEVAEDDQNKEGESNDTSGETAATVAAAAVEGGDATKSGEITGSNNNEELPTTTSSEEALPPPAAIAADNTTQKEEEKESAQPTKKKKKKGRPKGWKKKTPEEQAAINAAATAAAEAEAMKPRPFEYKFMKVVNPNDVLVPSALVIMVRGSEEEKKSLFGNEYGKSKKKKEEEEKEAVLAGEEKANDETKSGDVAMKETGEVEVNSKQQLGDPAKDGDGDAAMKDNNTATPAPTEVPASTTATTKTGPKPHGSPQKEPHPNIQTYGGLPFSDASNTYPTISPKSGKWQGHFENVGATTNVGRPSSKKKKNNTRNHIKEMFYLFFNATPDPSTARGVFADSDSTIRANDMLEDKGTTNVEDEKKKKDDEETKDKQQNLIPKDHIHVRGYGTNRFGTFEIIGSLNLTTGVLQCQRMYVPVPTVTEVSKVTGGTQREPYGRFMDLTILDEESEQRKAGSGRKRKTTWKKLLDDNIDVVLGPDGVPLPPSTDGKRRRRSGGEPAKKRSRSDSEGGKTGGKKRSRSDSEGGAAGGKKKSSAGKEGGGQLKAPPQCRGEGATSATKPPPSATPSTATGGGKRSKKRKDKGGGQASGGQQAAAAQSTQALSGPIRIAPPPVKAPTLPTSGDPVLARWRAAHYLYYQRVEQEPEDELGYNWANSSAASTNASASGGGQASGSGANKSGEINPDLVKISYVIYEGEMNDGYRHGKGVCLYNNNTLYEGEWKKNKEWGVGKLLTADRKRVIYEGAWEKGKIHGQGTYYYHLDQGNRPPKENGRYVGHFRQGLRNGVGVYTLADGSIYDGEFRDNIQNGYGIFRWPDGSIYEGAWRDGKRHGHGILVASDGFKYEGQWENNTIQGRGVGTYPKGQVYDGTWVAGKREGRGTIRFTNGAVYEGRFKEDRMEGQGTMKMSRNVIIPTLAPGAVATDDEKDASGNDGDTDMTDADAKEDSATKKKPKQSWMIPLQFQSDIGHIHMRAGFTQIGL